MTEVLFGTGTTQLTANDFTVNESVKMNLVTHKECCLVFFHYEDERSNYTAKIWNDVVSSTASAVFLSCDLIKNRQIASIMNSSASVNPSQSWINLSKIPLIMVYRRGIPVGVYNGIIDQGELLGYVSRIACDERYIECIIRPS